MQELKKKIEIKQLEVKEQETIKRNDIVYSSPSHLKKTINSSVPIVTKLIRLQIDLINKRI